MSDVIDNVSEMGISYEDMLNMTWKEYDYYFKGFNLRSQRKLDYLRRIMSNQFNSSGFSKKRYKPTDFFKLDLFDLKKEFKKVDDKTIEIMKKMINL